MILVLPETRNRQFDHLPGQELFGYYSQQIEFYRRGEAEYDRSLLCLDGYKGNCSSI